MEERTFLNSSQHARDYPTLYNYLFELPEFELEDNDLVYTIYNKRFYDEI